MTAAQLATAVVDCSRCHARRGVSCATQMKLDAIQRGDHVATEELEQLQRAGAELAHQERLDDLEKLIDSAEQYGLIRVG